MGNLYLRYDFFLLMQNTVRNMVRDRNENSYISKRDRESRSLR